MSKVIIKTPAQIAKIKEVSTLAIKTLEMIAPFVKAGVTTLELDQLCHRYIVEELHAIPAPLHYRGYPKSICTSVNEEICHGIPSSKVKLKDGDIINLDVTINKDGFYSDTSQMFIIGHGSKIARKLVQVTQECLYLAIQVARPKVPLSAIGKVIQAHAEQAGFSVVRDYCGHGVGVAFHEEPNVLHYANNHHLLLQPGMIFTIEPMINQGVAENHVLKNAWTAITNDHLLSAQWEHTILITEDGVEVLTKRSEEIGLVPYLC